VVVPAEAVVVVVAEAVVLAVHCLVVVRRWAALVRTGAITLR
jgi:hypothetical protein